MQLLLLDGTHSDVMRRSSVREGALLGRRDGVSRRERAEARRDETRRDVEVADSDAAHSAQQHRADVLNRKRCIHCWL